MACRPVILVVLGLICLAGVLLPGRGEDDALPDFNKPQDNSPLSVAKVNRVLGVAMFSEPSLWGEDAIFVAKRLGWPLESRTFIQSSYRLYPSEQGPVSVFGLPAYSCVLYATRGRPTEVSIVFINEGDYDWGQKMMAEAVHLRAQDASDTDASPDASSETNSGPVNPPTTNFGANPPTDFDSLNLTADDKERIDRDVHEQFAKALKKDAQTIIDALTGLFGDPAHEGFGGGSETRERVQRWDWQGHAFLLSMPKDKYVALRIVPVAQADDYGKSGEMERDDMRAMLLKRVKRDDATGDVVLSDIPMVDQGPKGYCVPATWERYLRYLGIPADMYVLAMAAGTSEGGGTNLDEMINNVDGLANQYHRTIDQFSGDLDLKTIEKNIDGGLPLMWTCSIHVPFEKTITRRMADRRQVTDWDAWATSLQALDKNEIADEIEGTAPDGLHQRMIIGYNAKTGEIAISDSWSRAFEIRWLTLAEANGINAGPSYVMER